MNKAVLLNIKDEILVKTIEVIKVYYILPKRARKQRKAYAHMYSLLQELLEIVDLEIKELENE